MRTRTEFQLLSPARRRRTVVASLALAMALATEFIGRHSPSDAHDSVAILVLLASALCSYLVFGRDAVLWLRPAFRFLERRVVQPLRRRSCEVGIDLRERPAIPAARPPLLHGSLVALTSICGALWIGLSVTDLAFRDLAKVFYIGHLALLTALWAGLIVTCAASLYIPTAVVHDFFTAQHDGPGIRSRRNEYRCVVAYFLITLTAGLTLPVWTPLITTGLALYLLVWTLWRTRDTGVTLLWRRTGVNEVHSVSWRSYQAECATVLVLGYFCLALLSLGDAALGFAPPDLTSTPFTVTLGMLAVWLGGMALTGAGIYASWFILQVHRRDPARPLPTTVHLTGREVDPETARPLIQRLGWRARFAPTPAQNDEVLLEMVQSPMPPLGSGPRRWPLRVSARGLEVPELQHVVTRRDTVQRRRAIMRGFERLLKHAAKRRYARGEGFWIAPHCWFVTGMMRDVDEEHTSAGDGRLLSQIIGPPYHRAMSPTARHHLFLVLDALEIDLIFLEDGVGFRGLRRVMRILFELYDVHGGRQRFEDKYGSGIPGVRCIVHDYELGRPLKKHGYPEPDCEIFGRARILHIFKDRGESEQLLDTPVDLDWIPEPVSV